MEVRESSIKYSINVELDLTQVGEATDAHRDRSQLVVIQVELFQSDTASCSNKVMLLLREMLLPTSHHLITMTKPSTVINTN